jgi:Domain of unknown function (DUF4262)
MCWLCDHPDAKWPDYLDFMRDLVDAHGWAVQAVERDRIHPPWAYTVGLTARGLPELVVTGMSARRAQDVLNDVAAHVLHVSAVVPGQQHALEGGPLIEIVELAEPTAHLFVAVELYGKELRAQQIVHADDRGHWPWDVGYRGVRGGQPVLGVRATPSASAA